MQGIDRFRNSGDEEETYPGCAHDGAVERQRHPFYLHGGGATPRRDTHTKNSKNMMTVVSNAFLDADQLRGWSLLSDRHAINPSLPRCRPSAPSSTLEDSARSLSLDPSVGVDMLLILPTCFSPSPGRDNDMEAVDIAATTKARTEFWRPW
jgi:hypothetical protein